MVSSTEAANNARIILNVVTAASSSARTKENKGFNGIMGIEGESNHTTKWGEYVPVYVGSDFSYGSLPMISKGESLYFLL